MEPFNFTVGALYRELEGIKGHSFGPVAKIMPNCKLINVNCKLYSEELFFADLQTLGRVYASALVQAHAQRQIVA